VLGYYSVLIEEGVKSIQKQGVKKDRETTGRRTLYHLPVTNDQ
jgi:hypothetical protein